MSNYEQLTEQLVRVNERTNDMLNIDVGNFGGMGILGGLVLCAVILIMNWRMIVKKIVSKSSESYTKDRASSGAIIEIKDKESDTLRVTVDQNERMTKTQENKINKVVETAAAEIAEIMGNKEEIKVTVNKILNNWSKNKSATKKGTKK